MKLHQTQTEFNCGIDLHARSMYICVMDREGNILVHRNVRGNDFAYFLKLVEPYRPDLTVACECTFNWYWLSDACVDADIRFVLGHALYMKAIHGTKTKNDKVDSKKIAHLLRSNMLPEAYCCSPEKRPVRDLLRRRIWLVRLRARVEGRMNAGVQVHGQAPLTRSETRAATKNLQMPDRYDNELLKLAMKSDCEVSHFLHRQILDIENAIMQHTRRNSQVEFLQLKSVPGFGMILPWVVLYEVDDIALRTCSLLTSRRAWSQSMLTHCRASSMGAPARAVICFPISEGSPDSLATKHLSDVCLRIGRGETPAFGSGPVSDRIPLRYRKGIRLFRLSHCRPSVSLPHGWLAGHRGTRRSDDLSTFRVIIQVRTT